jgi:hypothetical protein
MLQEVTEEEVVETPAPVDREEITETYADLDDDALGDLGGGFINNGYEDQDGMMAQFAKLTTRWIRRAKPRRGGPRHLEFGSAAVSTRSLIHNGGL